MRQILNYNIHDILKFQIIRDRRWDIRDLINLKFPSFQVDEVDKPDIVLNIGKFTPSNKNCYLIDHKYYIKDNYFYCRESESGIGWEVEVTGFEKGDAIINFNLAKCFQIHPVNIIYMPLFLPQAFLFRIIEHKLSMKNCFLAHAGAVAKDNQAYLLSGRAGCFKTTLCMEFVRRAGFTWLGDARMILYQGKVLGFPIHSLTFDFVTTHLPDETHWGFLRQVQFAAERLLDGPQETAKYKPGSAELKAILLFAKRTRLRNDKKVVFSSLPQTQVEQVVDGLITSSRLEDFKGMAGLGIGSAPFLRYMLAYAFVFPNSSFAVQERKLAENLRNTLANIPIYEVEIPPDYTLDTFDQIHQFIMQGGGV